MCVGSKRRESWVLAAILLTQQYHIEWHRIMQKLEFCDLFCFITLLFPARHRHSLPPRYRYRWRRNETTIKSLPEGAPVPPAPPTTAKAMFSSVSLLTWRYYQSRFLLDMTKVFTYSEIVTILRVIGRHTCIF